MSRKDKSEKTNVMRLLDAAKVSYRMHAYEPDATMSGEEIAGILGEDVSRVFKTLVTRGKSGQYYVFVIPVAEELDLKKAAKSAGEKSVAMIKQKELLPLTGYVHGGCSPIGMKKHFPTFIHESALDADAAAADVTAGTASADRIFVSAGKVGFQIELSAADLIREARCTPSDLV